MDSTLHEERVQEERVGWRAALGAATIAPTARTELTSSAAASLSRC